MGNIVDDMTALLENDEFVATTIAFAEITKEYGNETGFKVSNNSGDVVFSDSGIGGNDYLVQGIYPLLPPTNLICSCHIHTKDRIPIPSGPDIDNIDISSKKCNPIDAVCAIDGDNINITAYRRKKNTTTLEYATALMRQFTNRIIWSCFGSEVGSFTSANYRMFNSGLKRYLKERLGFKAIKYAFESTEVYEATILRLLLERRGGEQPTHYSLEVLA